MIKVTKGRIPKSKKVVLYGPEGIGKSTFAAQFPDPVFLDTEGSTAAMDVARIEPLSWTELLADIKEIISGNIDVPCRTIVVDTADWAEKMCADHVCAQNHWDSISSPGYGTGYRIAWEEYMADIPFEEDKDQILVEAVMELPAKYRIVIHLFYYEDYSVSEIGEILNVSQSAIKNRLLRARKMLKEKLKEDWIDE